MNTQASPLLHRQCALLALLLAVLFTRDTLAASRAGEEQWYVMRNHGVKVGWMRLATERSAKRVAMNDEVFFDSEGKQGRFVHDMTARDDIHLTPSHFALDVVRPRKPWSLDADIAAGKLTPRRQQGMPAITGSVKIAPEFATEFSAMRLAADLDQGEIRKVVLLGAWEKPLVVVGQLRYERDESVEIGGRKLAASRYVLSNAETADRIYWLDSHKRLIKVQVFGRVEFELADEQRAKASEAPRSRALAAAPAANAAVPAAQRGPLTASKLPVFPGASGFGTRTAAGRGGRVLEVTTLADDGAGSLRAALEARGARIVVFRVAGTITLTRPIEIHAPRVTVAGHSAPGGGILLRDAGLVVATDDVLIRHLRIRPGNSGAIDPENNDALQINGARNVVIDHVSLGWSEDEVVQVWQASRDVTLSWCLFSDALNKSRHPKGRHGAGVLIANGSDRVSLHHSLLANLDFRNPLVKDAGAVDLIENLVYDWGRTGAEVVDQVGREAQLNVIGNLYLPGPASGKIPAFVVNKGEAVGSVWPKIYAYDNRGPPAVADRDPQFAMFSLGFEGKPLPEVVRTAVAFKHASVKRIGANGLQAAILAEVGATRPRRDTSDARVIEQVRGNSGRIIDGPREAGGYPRLAAGTAPPDSDHDGMPDSWERSAGLNAKDAADAAADRDGDGYTNIEEYLESLIAP